MTAPVGTGVLFRAEVLDVEQVGATLSTTLHIPAIAPGCRYGPVPSIVPGVVRGEQVIVATLGASRNDFVVVQRYTPRWPTIEEVPGLASALADSATSFDLAQLRERLETANIARVALLDDVRELWASHSRTQSRVEEFPDALQRVRTDAAAAARTDAYARDDADRNETRTAMVGTTDRAVVPQCELRPTQDITNLPANTDLIISTLWSTFRDTEAAAGRTAMATIGTSLSAPTKVTLPTPGDYDVIFRARAPQGGNLVGHVLLNPDTSQSAASQVQGYSVFSDFGNGPGGTEGSLMRLSDVGRFGAGDVLVFALFNSVAWTCSQVYFGAVRSRIRVIRRPS